MDEDEDEDEDEVGAFLRGVRYRWNKYFEEERKRESHKHELNKFDDILSQQQTGESESERLSF